MHAAVVLRALFPSLFAILACQAPRPNVLEELPAPRLMQVQSAPELARAEPIGPGSWARIDWFAGRKKLGTLERRVSGEVLVDEQGQVPEANLQLQFADDQAPARLPGGLDTAANTLWLRWSRGNGVEGEAPRRAQLTWNRREGELPLQVQLRRNKSNSKEPRVLENLRPASIPLLDYGLQLDLSVEGNPSALTEALLTLHLQLPAPEAR